MCGGTQSNREHNGRALTVHTYIVSNKVGSLFSNGSHRFSIFIQHTVNIEALNAQKQEFVSCLALLNLNTRLTAIYRTLLLVVKGCISAAT